MKEYLTTGIAQVIPLIRKSCDDLTKQELIRYIAKITEEFLEGDPELADLILDNKKSLEACIRYVLNEAAYLVEKQVISMPDGDREMLPQRTVRGQKGIMAGGVVGKESVKDWVDAYYYKEEGLDPVGTKIQEKKKKDQKEEKTKKQNKKGKGGNKKADNLTEQSDSVQEEEVADIKDEQMSLFSA